MSWYVKSFRKLFFDFHTPSTAVEVAEDFDAEAWADQLVKAHVQGVSTTVQCGYGWRYYRKGQIGWVHPKLPHNLDIVGETINACQKRGIHVIGYYATLESEMLKATRPEWSSRDALGQQLGRSICLLSPALEEYVLPQLEEFSRNYEIDGMFFDGTYATGPCFCESCRKKFREDTGLEEPLDSESPYWRRFVEWKLERLKEVRQKICDAVHNGRSDVLVSFNWVYSTRQPEKPPKDVGFLSIDIFPNNQVFNASMQARFWATMDKPFDIMNSAQLQWWGHYDIKTAVSLQQECAAIIANGGRTWIGYQMYPQFRVEPAVMFQLAQALSFVREREHLCKNAKIVPYIAVSHSTHSYFTHKPSFLIDETSLKGAHKILLESGFHYNIILDEKLESEIDKYKAVILPDQRYVDPGLAEALRNFVREGGGLIATCLTGTLDEYLKVTGKFVLEDLFGVSLEGEYPYNHAYIEIQDERLKPNVLDMPILTWGKFTYVKPKSAEILAKLRGVYLTAEGKFLHGSSPPEADTGCPAITLNKFGKGNVVYISGNVFYGYMLNNQWNIKRIIKNALNLVLLEKLIEINAPPGVEVVLAKQNDKEIVHLINHYGERPIEKKRQFGDPHIQYNNAMTESVIPIYNINVRVKHDREPKKVTLEPGGKKLEWKMEDGVIHTIVPKLEIHSCVVIE